jgi:uncharacterized membrane protein
MGTSWSQQEAAMSDTSNLPPPSGGYDLPAAAEDKVLPIAIYASYLLFFVTGLTPIIGVIIAYMGRREPESWRTSHYEFAIWTFWLALAGSTIAWLLIGVGIPLTLIVVGIVPVIVGGVALAIIGIWFAVRSVLGLVYALKGEAYPRPRNLIV